jgi:hypothetical protein
VPAGGAASSGNKVLNKYVVPAMALVQFDLKSVLGTSDFISALASSSTSINLYISGGEITT